MMSLRLHASDVLLTDDLTPWQQEQFRHDQRNHSDILNMPRPDRLKHYGLHFAKYVGRLARGSAETKPVDRTIVDAALICLSAANSLNQRLKKPASTMPSSSLQTDKTLSLADAAGRFADACEKIDHLEEFLLLARTANEDILKWVFTISAERHLNLSSAIKVRRKEIADRQFYIMD
ncbi:hypothetical protein [Methylocystis heyeri]|uniref:Uncharacterized protein n=1 Tax=Methylocystis heyeri TaxID=391905 RepID=A0A6B8KFI7_9HYPH|nr:hypothetical protein [Methylocystis heyeri]QGM45190.1 hypothetical protein H2LOC_005495 [Methylocystis heyeri]